MERINDMLAGPNVNGTGKSGFIAKNAATNQIGTPITPFWLNGIQEEGMSIIEYAGLVPNGADNTQMLQAILRLIANHGRPYDLHFISGWGPDGTGADLAVQVIGRTIMPRDVRVSATRGKLYLAPTGAPLILDVEKNGVSIFSTKPQFEIGATALTPGVIPGGHVDFATNDLLTVRIPQIGSTIKGQGLCYALVGAAL